MRYTRLDGLRGLLAVLVALNHSFMILAIPAFANIWGQDIFHYTSLQSKLQQLSMLIGNGGLAVSIFFVLSGFVLAESSKNWDFSLSQIITFYIRRFLRLYPVYLFLIIVSALYMWTGFVYRTYPAASSWFHWWMQFDMTLKELLLNATFVHTYLGGVTWTLRVILLASLLFPPLIYLSKKMSLRINVLFFILLAWASFKLLDFRNFNDLRFTYMFFLGSILPRFKQMFQAKIPPFFVLTLIPLTIYVLNFRYQNEIHLAGLVESLYAFLILGLMSYKKLRLFNFLDSRPFQFLGKISYSLYLVHFTVLYIFSKFALDHISPNLMSANYFLSHTLMFLVTTALAIGVSLLVHKYLETPALTLSKRVKLNKS